MTPETKGNRQLALRALESLLFAAALLLPTFLI
jgi:hypothetical protein